MNDKELLYGGARRGGFLTYSIHTFINSTDKCMVIMTPTKHRANTLAKTLRKSYAWLRIIPKTFRDTSHPKAVVSYDGEVMGVVPDVRESFGVEIKK